MSNTTDKYIKRLFCIVLALFIIEAGMILKMGAQVKDLAASVEEHDGMLEQLGDSVTRMEVVTRSAGVKP